MSDKFNLIRSDIIARKFDLASFGVPGEIAEFHDCMVGGQINKLCFGRFQIYNPESLVGIGWAEIIPDENIVDREQLNVHIPIGWEEPLRYIDLFQSNRLFVHPWSDGSHPVFPDPVLF